MNALVLSENFPSRLNPWRGPYNRRQVECLSNLCRVTVVNPIPFPKLLGGREQWRLAAGPDGVLDGIALFHPTWWYAPVVGRCGSWRGFRRAVERAERRNGPWKCDVILATFAYPAGAAARDLARRMGVPYVVKVRGSDLHSLPRFGKRRALTAQALRDAAAMVAVSGNLAEIAAELGAEPSKVHVLTNGIDAAAFPLLFRRQARRRLGVPAGRKTLLFVGSLLPVKGVDVLLEALARLGSDESAKTQPPVTVLVGDGPMRRNLAKQAQRAGLADRVVFSGHLGREDVALWMNAADALVLPSRNEGCPNVVLEALACGTPVVASRVGAVPDLIDDSSGIVVPPEDPGALAAALDQALRREWDREALRKRVEGMSWESNAARLHGILAEAAGLRGGRPLAAACAKG